MPTQDQDVRTQIVELMNALVTVREERDLSRLTVAKLMGFTTHSAADRFEQDIQDPMFSKVLRYAHAIGVRVHATVTAPDGQVSPEVSTLPDDSTQLSQVQRALVAIRTAQGRTQAQVSEGLDCVPHGVYVRERSGDLRLSTLLRYAAALGARVDFSLSLPPGEGEDEVSEPRCRDRPGAAAWPHQESLASRIAEALRTRIEGAEWPPGGCMPTQQELCAEYNCTLPTVGDALRVLRATGLVAAGFGDHPHVHACPGEVDLSRDLADLAHQVGQRRWGNDDPGLDPDSWLADLQQRLTNLAGLAEQQNQRP
ncbi:GntR family transcriptional regulator [Prauserella alba]|nr:GntR family transcriptional regulator [Prauserella alba]MCP2179253.1 regulatory protein, gntR family [Prauserella alba]